MEIENYTVLHTRLLEIYHKLGITNEEMLFLIHLISFQQQQEYFPSIQDLQKRMDYSDEKMYDTIEALMERGLLLIESSKKGQGLALEKYSLAPLYLKATKLEEQQENTAQPENEQIEIFEVIETEFGRQLSPIEYQQVSSWFTKDKFSASVILEAVKEAVLNQVYNLKYIDRILINWQKQNHHPGAKGPQNKTGFTPAQNSQSGLPPVPLDKWLN